MDEKAYEQYVANVVQNLRFSDKANVYTNRKYPGIRQPGIYEIDISFELSLDDKLFFLVIIECKNWSRPIDRPQVQKLIQTRDALSAHKAAFASPVGYTKEAIEVAKANGVALWVLAEGVFHVSAGGGLGALSICFRLSDCLRKLIYDCLNYNSSYRLHLKHYRDPSCGQPNLVPVLWLPSDAQLSPNTYLSYAAVDPYETAYDPIMSEVIRYSLLALPNSNFFTRMLHTQIEHFAEFLQKAGLSTTQSSLFLDRFVIPMVTDGLSVPDFFEKLQSFDLSIRHSDVLWENAIRSLNKIDGISWSSPEY